MARDARRQRRDQRRAASGDAQPGRSRSRNTRPDERLDGEAEVDLDELVSEAEASQPSSEVVTTVGAPRRRGNFIRESWAELKKVDWPTRPQVIQGTAVVIIACAIVGAYLWGVDQVVRPFVRDVLLGN